MCLTVSDYCTGTGHGGRRGVVGERGKCGGRGYRLILAVRRKEVGST